MSLRRKQWIHVILMSAVSVLVIFCIHYVLPSILNVNKHYLFSLRDVSHRIDHYFAENMLIYHVTHPAFVRRLWVSGGMELIHQAFSVSYAYSFILINFSGLFLCGLLVYHLSRLFGHSHRAGYVSMLLFFSSFTILFAFTLEMSTYDDIIQYILLWLTLLYIYKQQLYGMVITFFLALWARETTLFMIPGLLLFFYPYGKSLYNALRDRVFQKLYILLGVLSAVYLVLLYTVLRYFHIDELSQNYLTHERFMHWAFNFGTLQEGLLTMVSLIYALGVPMCIVWTYVRHHHVSPLLRRMMYAGIVVLIINTVMVFTSARVREARLLALPLIFVWPFLGQMAITIYRDWQHRMRRLTRKKVAWLGYGSLWVIFVGLSYVFCFVIFKPRIAIELLLWFRLYVFLFLVGVSGYYVSLPFADD